MNSISINFLLLTSSFFIFSAVTVVKADPEKKNNTTPTVRFCYECTSVLHPGCADGYEGSDKFPHEGKLKYNYSRDCSTSDNLPFTEEGKPKPVAVGCRKILQEVDSKTRVVRECAYTKSDGADEVSGLKRTGNQGVRLFYYQCPRDYCNGANSQSAAFFLLSFFLPFILALAARW
jgi:hypothetical protein